MKALISGGIFRNIYFKRFSQRNNYFYSYILTILQVLQVVNTNRIMSVVCILMFLAIVKTIRVDV